MITFRNAGKLLLLSLALIVTFGVLCPVVLAQVPLLPATYRGTVTDATGEPAPDGTQVSAVIGGESFGPVEVSNGRYWLPIVIPDKSSFGKTIRFYVNSQRVDQTAIYPDVTDPDADSFPTVNLTIPATPFPAEMGDATLPSLMLAILCLGAVMCLGGIFIMKRRARV